jgi:hypothetical protein
MSIHSLDESSASWPRLESLNSKTLQMLPSRAKMRVIMLEAGSTSIHNRQDPPRQVRIRALRCTHFKNGTICEQSSFCYRWPFLHPLGAAVWSDCIAKRYDVLACVTTMDARRKYRVRDLFRLPWVRSPEPPYQARYYLKSNIIFRALQEKNEPRGLKKARDTRSKRAMARSEKKEACEASTLPEDLDCCSLHLPLIIF